MPEQYTYLLVDICCIIFPLLFSFYPKFHFYSQWRYFLGPCLFTALFFSVWDILFTRMGVWSFNSQFIAGAYLFGLPAEEYLFFICIPYACTFTYYCLTRYFTLSTTKVVRIFTIVMASLLALIAFMNVARLYTSVTFLLLSVFLLFLVAKKVQFLAAFYVAFLLILIPFFISNGILTGGIIHRTVVLYNNNRNLGIRMFTIPVEDTFYGMLLLLMNISGFEYNRQKGVLKP